MLDPTATSMTAPMKRVVSMESTEKPRRAPLVVLGEPVLPAGAGVPGAGQVLGRVLLT